MKHTVENFPPSYVLQGFHKQRKLPYELMLRLAELTPEGAQKVHDELKREVQKAEEEKLHKKDFSPFASNGKKRPAPEDVVMGHGEEAD